jgi:hypothetical protein
MSATGGSTVWSAAAESQLSLVEKTEAEHSAKVSGGIAETFKPRLKRHVG